MSALENSPPTISVLMPSYNHAAYVKAAIDSVLVQTCPDFELIVIDDASTDETYSIIEGIADPRIRLSRHNNNEGSHATLNEALRLAQGRFIAIINSDDRFHPERLALCLEAIQHQDADMLGTDIELLDTSGQPVTSHWWIDAFADLKSAWHTTHDWPTTLLAGNVFMTTSNFFFRRSWIDTVGEFHAYRYVLDYEWLLRGLVLGKHFAWLDQPLLQYRLHDANTISEKPRAANHECARLLREMLPLLVGADTTQRLRLEHFASQWARIEKYLDEIADTQRHEALVAKENELFQLIADRDTWIADRDAWIAERDAWIAERDAWIAERDDSIQEHLQSIHDRDRQIDKYLATVDIYKRELAAILASRTYRLGHVLTAPARWLRKAMRYKG